MAGLISPAELRDEWARLQREPLDQYWVGPGAFVERLLGTIEDQQARIAALWLALTPFVTEYPECGAFQVQEASAVWQANTPSGVGVTQEEGTR